MWDSAILRDQNASIQDDIAAGIVDQAEAGAVLVSATVWRNLGDRLRGTSKGLVELKGKGDVELIQCEKAG